MPGRAHITKFGRVVIFRPVVWAERMALREYDELDATAMAELVRGGELSPSELLAAAIERIELRDRTLGAVVTRLFDGAARQIAEGLPDGPLTGVPMLVKDLLMDVAGVPTTYGSRMLQHWVPREDSEIVRRWKRAGLVVVGKTNVPEFGIVGVTEPALHGPTRNPWNTAHTSGGSSGGSAAAVAARMVPIAGAGDGGGSIRIPASCCGLVGLKPTRGRTPNGPPNVDGWSGLVAQHVLTRTIRDTALALDVEAGSEPGTTWVPSPAPRSYATAIAEPPPPLRIAVFAGSIFPGENHPECAAAVERTAENLRRLGHVVCEAVPELDRRGLARAWCTLVAANVAADVSYWERELGRPAGNDIEPLTALARMIGRNISAQEFVDCQNLVQRCNQRIAEFFADHDVLVTSSLAAPPARVGAFDPPFFQRVLMAISTTMPTVAGARLAREMMIDGPQLAACPNTQLANLTGQPAISLPLATHANGLPLGIQFVARWGDEVTLLQLGHQLELAHGWTRRRPEA